MNLSQQLCEICGIEPKCINCGQTVSDNNPCPKPCKKQKYPDFEKPENYTKLFALIETIGDFTCTLCFYYINQNLASKKLSHLKTSEGDYENDNINELQAFLTCVLKCVAKEKDTAELIKKTEWKYER